MVCIIIVYLFDRICRKYFPIRLFNQKSVPYFVPVKTKNTSEMTCKIQHMEMHEACSFYEQHWE
jgi:hypothetical protein